jgi:cell division protein FtsB
MRARVFVALAGGVALAIAAYAVVSPSGVSRLWKLEDREKALAVDVEKQKHDNAKLAAEVKILQGNEPASKAVLEKHAREELGYVKADEVIVTGLPVTTTTTASTATTSTSSSSPGSP